MMRNYEECCWLLTKNLMGHDGKLIKAGLATTISHLTKTEKHHNSKNQDKKWFKIRLN